MAVVSDRALKPNRVAVVASHPIQYQAPLFRELAHHVDLTVMFCHRATPEDQAKAGFGIHFDWDTDLTAGYKSCFLENRARHPNVERFSGCNTPGIKEELRRINPDAVIVMGWYLRSYLQAVHAAKRLGIPVLVRGDTQLQMSARKAVSAVKWFVMPTLLRRFDAFLVVGQRFREYLESYGVPRNKMFFSPHCVDQKLFRADRCQRQKHEPPVALFVGKFLPRKRPLDLVAAVARLNRQGRTVRIRFVGAGPMDAEIVERAAASGVDCEMLGFRNQSELPSTYAAGDVLVLPSDATETWGLVVNEGFCLGLPAVVSDAVGCVRDLIDPGTGFVYPCGDIQELAECIWNAVRASRTRPSLDAIDKKCRLYSVENAVAGMLEAIRYTGNR